MNSSSNILQFSTLFDLVYSVEDDRQAIERIFGKRKIIKSKYEEKPLCKETLNALCKMVVNWVWV